MKYCDHNKTVSNIQIDFSCVNSADAIEGDDFTMLPYEDSNFLFSIRTLFDDVVKDLGLSWHPNYEKSKAYFYISGNEVALSVEVFPRHYSAIEKQAMFAAASKDERENGWSDYLELINMFDDIDEILNCAYPVGEVGTYPLVLTPEEKAKLFLYK